MKFRFWMDWFNFRSRKHASSLDAGMPIHARGWNAGVKITPRVGSDNRDVFEVAMTHGSHGAGSDSPIGEVRDTKDGPRYVPYTPAE